MTRETFFARRGPFTVGELAVLTGAEPAAGADLDRVVNDVAPFTQSRPDEVTAIIDRARLARADGMAAGACFIAPGFRLPAAGLAIALVLLGIQYTRGRTQAAT